jgi:hypothetical protein
VVLGNKRGNGAHLYGGALTWAENGAGGSGFNVGGDFR